MPQINRRSPYRNWRAIQAPGLNYTINRRSWQAQGLVGWWPVLGGSGQSVLYDRSGNFEQANEVNSAGWARDPEFGAVPYFDDSAYFATAKTLPGISFCTFSVWIKIASRQNFEQYFTAGGFHTYLAHSSDAVSPFSMDFRTATTAGASTATAANVQYLNRWQLFAGTYDGANVSIWTDGVLSNSAANVGTLTAPGGVVQIGARAGLNTMSDGWLYDPRIYDHALSAGEMRELHAPATRGDLFKPAPRAFFMGPLVVAGNALPMAWKQYRQRRV